MKRSDLVTAALAWLDPPGTWHRPEDLIPLLRGRQPALDEAGLRDVAVELLLDLAEREEVALADGWPPWRDGVVPIAVDARRARLADPLTWNSSAAQDGPPLAFTVTERGASRSPVTTRWRLLGFAQDTDAFELGYAMERPDPTVLRARLLLPQEDALLDSYPVPADDLAWWADLAGVPELSERHDWFAES